MKIIKYRGWMPFDDSKLCNIEFWDCIINFATTLNSASEYISNWFNIRIITDLNIGTMFYYFLFALCHKNLTNY